MPVVDRDDETGSADSLTAAEDGMLLRFYALFVLFVCSALLCRAHPRSRYAGMLDTPEP